MYAEYADADAAALHDLLNPWGRSDDFYLSQVMGRRSVLDVDCGTGILLHRARVRAQRLCRLDPDVVALDRALRLPNVVWVEGRTGRACASSTSTASTPPGGAGFEVEARHGDWSRGPLTATSDDIDFVAAV